MTLNPIIDIHHKKDINYLEILNVFITIQLKQKELLKMNFDQPTQNDRIYNSKSLLDRYFVMHILFIHIPITIGDMVSDGFQVTYRN